MKNIHEVEILLKEFYSKHKTYKEKREKHFSEKVIYNTENGLGDNLILTSVFPNIKANSEVLSKIKHEYINTENITNEKGISISELSSNDWGGGHCIQRLQRALGIDVDLKPKGKIKFDNRKKIRNKIFVHLTNDTDWKRIIPNSLSLFEIKLIERFFEENTIYEPYYFYNNLDINELISIMETCEYFLGIDSGPMHLAAAMDLKSIIIINDPESYICLPKIKECELPNAEWLYPQNVHLNRAGESELVPKFDITNVLSAINGFIYPYWSEQYLTLKYSI